MAHILLATGDGLVTLRDPGGERSVDFPGESVVAVSVAGDWTFAAVEGGGAHRRPAGGAWEHLGLTGETIWTVAGTDDGTAFVGLEPAAIWRVTPAGAEGLAGLEKVAGHESWESPWGPADLCSIVVDGDRLVVGVEVGGVAVSSDAGETWEARNDGLYEDVHHVVADGTNLYATTGGGFYRSRDEGRSWAWQADGVDRGYSQGLALAGGRLVMSAASGPPPMWDAGGPEAAIFVADADAEPVRWRLVHEGFAGNVERQALAASGDLVVAGTSAGEVLMSRDAGETFTPAVVGAPAAVRAVTLGT